MIFFTYIAEIQFYFSNSVLFIHPRRDLCNYFTMRVEREWNMPSKHP